MAKKLTEEQKDQCIGFIYSTLNDLDPEDQNEILIGLRDKLYTRRLHKLEDMQTMCVNLDNDIKTLKGYNAEIGHTQL